MEPLISVIVPVYNVEQYLGKCVDSLLDQDYPNLEIVLVDDGSPDQCGALCDRYAADHENVRSLHKPNGGLGDARNYGVRHAEGEYIAFVDSDDYVEPSFISDLWALMAESDCDLVMARLVREPENSTEVKRGDKFEPFQAEPEAAIFEAYSGIRVGWSACNKLFKKTVLLQYPFPKGYYEDCAVMYRIIYACRKIVIADLECNYHYVERTGSILKSKLEEKHLHIFEICREFDDFVKQEGIQDDVLSAVFYRRAVTQILNLQSMDRETYDEIFYRYQDKIKQGLKKILSDPRLSKKIKIHSLLLCTTPGIYRLQSRVVQKTR